MAQRPNSPSGQAAPQEAPHTATKAQQSLPRVDVVMGSSSDWPVMQHAVEVLQHFEVPYTAKVISAHRMPNEMVHYAQSLENTEVAAIIAGAGGAAHLPGMLAALTPVPVFGVPVPSRYLRGEDSLLSIVQMPKGVPVATFAIGEAGASNAALHAIACLAVWCPSLRKQLNQFRAQQTAAAQAMRLPPENTP